MDSIRKRLLSPIKSKLKRRLAGEDLDALVERRARKRLRWIATESDDPVLRFRAIRNLAELLDPESTDLFCSIASAEAGSESTANLRSAAEGLGRLLNGDTAVVLRRLLDPHRPATVQLAAARGLAMIGRPDDWGAIRPWAPRAEGDSALFPDDRDCVAASGNGEAGTQSLVWVLETIYADKAARWWSSKASKWLGSDDPKPRMDADRGADKIVAAAHRNALDRKDLSNEDFCQIVLHLGSLARDRDYPLFVELLRAQEQDVRRHAVIQALGIHGDPRAIPLFEQWLSEVPDDQPHLAADLLRAAGRLGWPQLSEPCIALWDSFEETEVRLNLIWALGESGGDAAVRFLLEQVRRRDLELNEEEMLWIARSLRRCGVIGREAIRGAVAMARAGGGERDRVARLAELAGVH